MKKSITETQLEKEPFGAKITLTYWWEDENGKRPRGNSITDQLDKASEERIMEMVKEGYTSGDLIYETDKHNYSGWWEKNTERT